MAHFILGNQRASGKIVQVPDALDNPDTSLDSETKTPDMNIFTDVETLILSCIRGGKTHPVGFKNSETKDLAFIFQFPLTNILFLREMTKP